MDNIFVLLTRQKVYLHNNKYAGEDSESINAMELILLFFEFGRLLRKILDFLALIRLLLLFYCVCLMIYFYNEKFYRKCKFIWNSLGLVRSSVFNSVLFFLLYMLQCLINCLATDFTTSGWNSSGAERIVRHNKPGYSTKGNKCLSYQTILRISDSLNAGWHTLKVLMICEFGKFSEDIDYLHFHTHTLLLSNT